MRQKEKLEKMFEQEKNVGALEDLSVVNALLILVLALVFLTDVARYQWILLIILVLGSLLNSMLALCGAVRKQWVLGGIFAAMTFGYLGTLVYLLIW